MRKRRLLADGWLRNSPWWAQTVLAQPSASSRRTTHWLSLVLSRLPCRLVNGTDPYVVEGERVDIEHLTR